MKKILIVNEGFSSNLGDQAIKRSILDILRAHGQEADFAQYSNPGLRSISATRVASHDTQITGNKEAVTKNWISGLRTTAGHVKWYVKNSPAIKKLLQKAEYDTIIIGGGQLIGSSEKIRFNAFALALYCWVTAAKKYTRAKIYIMGVGAAGSFHKTELYFYKKALQQADSIWVRDSYSQKSLQKNFQIKAGMMPDFAFYDASCYTREFQKDNTALVGIYGYEEFAGKFDKAGLTREEYYVDWLAVVKRYAAEGLNVKLFYTTRSDAAECFLFQDHIRQQHHMEIEIAATESLDDLLLLYSRTKKLYSARMHALLLGIKYKCIVEAYFVNEKLETFDREYIKSGKTPKTYSDEIESLMTPLLN